MRTVLAATLMALLGACAGGSAPRSGIEIRLFQFSPNPAHVAVGSMVAWRNSDDIAHTVTSGAPGATTGVFDSGNFAKGQTFSFVFSKQGEYEYFCRNHNTMRGRIVVT